MATSSSLLEQLPVELQLLVLQNVSDLATLLSLIAASPQLLNSFLKEKTRIRLCVVYNQLGSNLPNALIAIGRSALIASPTPPTLDPPSIEEARLLFQQDRLVNSLVQKCVNMQLKSEVHLSEVEVLRMRRGMYNYMAAKIFMHQAPTVFKELCKTMDPKENLEVLYILHCLRDLAKDHITRLENLLFEKIQDRSLDIVRKRYDFRSFSSSGQLLQKAWLIACPWVLSLQEFSDITLPVKVIDIEKYEGYWPNEHILLHYDQLMRNVITMGYQFNESSYPGINPCSHALAREPLDANAVCFSSFMESIPYGHMIWDENRLSQMWWNECLYEAWYENSVKVTWRDETVSLQSRLQDLQIQAASVRLERLQKHAALVRSRNENLRNQPRKAHGWSRIRGWFK